MKDMLDAAFLSHALFWLIGAMTVCATVLATAALFSMGRSGYRKD
ncbi:hypothetical protein GCM10017596_15850 [Microbacterium keratanolyticum]|uniref:Uncharacterized protein n=1 Tax=Microbacterium keratanolyticum TaxID=67574 RepID=A0A9W6HT22_9MICO|nr:hypothetical protein GCM10017596_15850 [Microbacterium keratanolyticum]